MAKGKQIKITERKLKDGNIHFYAAGRKLTPAQKKEFFKSQIDKTGFEADRLSKEDRQLLGRIKGGISAANKAVRLSNGQIVKRDIAKAAKKLKIDLEAGLKATGFKTLKELETAKPEFFAALNEYLEKGRVVNWYNVGDTKDNIADFRGKDIILNGVKVSKSTAKNRVSEFNQELLHILGSDAYQSAIKITFNGIDSLEITLPEIDDIPYGITVSEFNDLFGDDNDGNVKVFGSPTPSK